MIGTSTERCLMANIIIQLMFRSRSTEPSLKKGRRTDSTAGPSDGDRGGGAAGAADSKVWCDMERRYDTHT